MKSVKEFLAEGKLNKTENAIYKKILPRAKLALMGAFYDKTKFSNTIQGDLSLYEDDVDVDIYEIEEEIIKQLKLSINRTK